MTKKEKKQLLNLKQMIDEMIDIIDTTDALSKDKDGAQTHNAFVLESRLIHLRGEINKSVDNETLEVLDWNGESWN